MKTKTAPWDYEKQLPMLFYSRYYQMAICPTCGRQVKVCRVGDDVLIMCQCPTAHLFWPDMAASLSNIITELTRTTNLLTAQNETALHEIDRRLETDYARNCGQI